MNAVGPKAATVSLLAGDDSLHSTTEPGGTIPQISFASAVARLGAVDVVKLDCEGAEWDIFTDPKPWTRIRSLVMEYHLWARPGVTEQTLISQLKGLGFSIVELVPSDDRQWGLAMAFRPNI
jgi:hypothetical protein